MFISSHNSFCLLVDIFQISNNISVTVSACEREHMCAHAWATGRLWRSEGSSVELFFMFHLSVDSEAQTQAIGLAQALFLLSHLASP